MKKIISVLLVFVLSLTLVAPVFASGDVLIAGESQTITLKKDTKETKTFTSAKGGVYHYTCDIVVDKSDSTGFIIYAYRYEGDELIASYSCTRLKLTSGSDYVTAVSEYFYAKPGVTYSIEYSVEFLSDTENTTTVVAQCAVMPYDAQEIKIGSTYTCTVDAPAFVICPTQATTYNITADVYDYFTVNDGNNDVAESGLNPDQKLNATFELKGGKVYLLTFKEIPDTDYRFTVKDGAVILPESVQIPWSLEMPVGSSKALAYDIYPVGSEINSAGVEVTVGDTSIASVEYVEKDSNGYSYYLIHALKKGTTTITVTEKTTGVSATKEVHVVSQLYYNLANSSFTIFRMFAKLVLILENLFNR